MRASPSKDYHLVVLVHGLWGNGSHFDYISNSIDTSLKTHDVFQPGGKLAGEEIVVYTTCLNEGYKTYDGIDVCGLRVAKEIEDQIETLGSVIKFSLVGYSLGGLIARYALGILYKKQLFKKHDIELINFTTFCTPHVGVYAPGKNIAVNLFNTIVPFVLGNSGKQMFLKDQVRSAGNLPLVYLMSMENSVFYKALQEFKYKALYANVINDKRTAWWTSGISKNDPFFGVDQFNGVNRFSYIPGFEPIILDHSKPIRISKLEQVTDDGDVEGFDLQLPQGKGEDEEKMVPPAALIPQRYEFFFINYWCAKLGRWLMVLLNLLIIAPLWVIWFFVSGTMETMKSTLRVTKFFNQYSHQFIHDYFELSHEQPLQEDSGEEDLSTVVTNDYEMQIEQSLNDQADTLIESVFNAIERKNTHTAIVDDADPDADEGFGNTESMVRGEHSIKTTIRELELYSVHEIISKKESLSSQQMAEESLSLLENFHLNITPRQLEIIDSLNKIHWKKFPIYIRNTTSTHACSIVRHKDPAFTEGEKIVNHWIQNVFEFE